MSDEIAKSPRVGVFICDCGVKISSIIDTEALRERVSQISEVVYATHDAYPCSKDGQARIKEATRAHGLERVLIAGCSPRLVENLFRRTIQSSDLDPAYINIVDIREQCAYVHALQAGAILGKAMALVDMGVARLATTTAPKPHTGRLVKSALVVGSGLSALTVALATADAGMRVVLVERSNQLGGVAPDLQERTRVLIEEKSQLVLRNPLIDVLFNGHLVEVTGHPGDYEIKVQHGDQTTAYAVGVIVVSNTAQPKSLGSDQWFDRSRVKTQAEFERELDDLTLTREEPGIHNIVFILCAEPSQREHCSRVCCNIGIRQAIQVKRLNPDANITILFRDLYLGGIGEAYEGDFIEARKVGVTFFRYRKETPPVIGDTTVDVVDSLTGEPVRVEFDRVVLSMPLIPQDNTPTVAALLSLPHDEAGFLAEPRIRLRPGRYLDAGIYVLGSAQQPADTAEALFQAYLTSSRINRFLGQEKVSLEMPVAEINSSLCTGCGNCARVCPTSAVRLEKRDGLLSLSEVDEFRCIGCGNCVVVCPVKAITLPGWDNIEIPAQISAVLQSRTPSDEIVPNILALACEWSAYAAADMAGARRLTYPANVRILRMNCSARFDPYHILWAFLNRAQGVFLGACPPGECHYGTGNLYARERVEVLKKELQQHGINPDRLHLEFLTADDGLKFAQAVTKFVEEIVLQSSLQ